MDFFDHKGRSKELENEKQERDAIKVFVLVCFGYYKVRLWLTVEKNGGYDYSISGDNVCI